MGNAKPDALAAAIPAVPSFVEIGQADRDDLDGYVQWMRGYQNPVLGKIVAELLAANDRNRATWAANSPEIALAAEVADELGRAIAKHAPMASPHEGWSVILEELEELRDHVRGDTGRGPEARKEALQIAAMGLRYAMDLCGGDAPA